LQDRIRLPTMSIAGLTDELSEGYTELLINWQAASVNTVIR